MLESLMALFLNRRIFDRRHYTRDVMHDRRKPTFKDANRMMKNAVDDFSETITYTPEKLRELCRKK